MPATTRRSLCAPASSHWPNRQIVAKRGAMEVIVVDDGSTDRMFEVAKSLQREGLVDKVLRLDHRGGKSAAVNLGLSICTGDVVVISDADTTFDRDAFAELLSYFSDPRVGAVSGNLGVRNAAASLITRHQAIEYAIGISLGRSIQDMLGILSIASGAFGAFRRSAIEASGRTGCRSGRGCRPYDEATPCRLENSLCSRCTCADRRSRRPSPASLRSGFAGIAVSSPSGCASFVTFSIRASRRFGSSTWWRLST